MPMIVPGLRPRSRRAGIRRVPRASVVGALWLAIVRGPRARRAQDHADATRRRSTSNALVKVVREATERFKDVSVAEREGFGLLFGCVSGGEWGAMGLHYVNLPLVIDGELDPAHPEIVIYEPTPNGRLRITGADYLVFAADWEAKHPGEPPQLMGQLLHLFEAPESVRAAGVLHAACVGVEGESGRDVRELAPEGVV